MPHAALWVVQRCAVCAERSCEHRFNAARGFVGGATMEVFMEVMFTICFNAARGFVCGATGWEVVDCVNSDGFNAARGFVGGAAATTRRS